MKFFNGPYSYSRYYLPFKSNDFKGNLFTCWYFYPYFGRKKFHWVKKCLFVHWPSLWFVYFPSIVFSVLNMLSGYYLRLCFAIDNSHLEFDLSKSYVYWDTLPKKLCRNLSYASENTWLQVLQRVYTIWKLLGLLLRTRHFRIRNLTCSLPAFVWFLIHQQLVRRSRARTLFMNYICIFCFFFPTFSCRLLTSGRIRSL